MHLSITRADRPASRQAEQHTRFPRAPLCRRVQRRAEKKAIKARLLDEPVGAAAYPRHWTTTPSTFVELALSSDFEKHCKKLGGLADIRVTVDPQYMESCCDDYPAERLLPILLRFQKDETAACRHWPWAAVAIDQYTFERSAWEKYAGEPGPKEIIEILKEIKNAARDLGAGFAQLQAFSYRLSDPSAPLRRAHLAWLDAFILQAIAGRISTDVNEDDRHTVVDYFKKIGLLGQLADVEVAAKEAMRRIDKSLLKRVRSQSDPALPSFVFRCGAIWKSLTGRKPSAEKVYRKNKGDPDFVIFVQDLAKFAKSSARLDPPSRDQVATSLRKRRPRN